MKKILVFSLVIGLAFASTVQATTLKPLDAIELVTQVDIAKIVPTFVGEVIVQGNTIEFATLEAIPGEVFDFNDEARGFLKFINASLTVVTDFSPKDVGESNSTNFVNISGNLTAGDTRESSTNIAI